MDLVRMKGKDAVCDSLDVAEHFGKQHGNVIQTIDNLTAENSAVKKKFKRSTYRAENGHVYRRYYMDRDGFSLLVMGFNGIITGIYNTIGNIALAIMNAWNTAGVGDAIWTGILNIVNNILA